MLPLRPDARRGPLLPPLLAGVLACCLLGSPGRAHNLDQVNTYIALDATTQALIQTRAGNNETLIQKDDVLGFIFKSTPGPGTDVGAGGYFTFYVPVGTQVVEVDYGKPDGLGGFTTLPLKAAGEMPLGEGNEGRNRTSDLIGLSLGPNVIGNTVNAVDSSGDHNGTLAGVYGDNGIFFSTDPRTAWNSWVDAGGYDGNTGSSDNVLTNNVGDELTPTNHWDAEQLIAFGLKKPSKALIDPDGRGTTPWGMGNPVAGPQSGYAWGFNWQTWKANPSAPDRMKQSIEVGPWQRIQYPGSTVASDTPGSNSPTYGTASVDGSSYGVAVSPATPLPATLSQTDTTSTKAIRVAFGRLVLGESEYARVKLKILANAGETHSPFGPDGSFEVHTDVSGGDAAEHEVGKDHIWRYIKASPLTLNTGVLMQKQFLKTPVAESEISHFDLTVSNTTTAAVSNVVLTDPVPSNLTYLGASITPASTSPLQWNLGSLAAQQSVTIRVQYQAKTEGTTFNTATVTYDGGWRSATDSVDIRDSGGLPPLMSVGNLVFNDRNQNGRADAGEGISGVPVQLYDSEAYLESDSPLLTQTTTANGSFLFANLPPGGYKLHLPSTAFQDGGPLHGLFSLPGTALGDDDVSEDGIDASEPWVSGITSLEFQLGTGNAPTASEGETGFQSTSDDLVDSQVDLTYDFGLSESLAVGNLVFIDANGNGRADDGEGYDGVTLELYRAIDDINTAVPIDTTTTANGGLYLFSGVAPGTYRIHIPKEMFTVSTPLHAMISIPDGIAGDDDVGDDGNAIGDLSVTGVTSGVISLNLGQAPTLASGETGVDADSDDDVDAAVDLTVDFGFQQPLRLGNLVFIDANANGRADAGEGVSGVTVELHRGDSDPALSLPLFTTTTDANGIYDFRFLQTGEYIVYLPPSNFDSLAPLAGRVSMPGLDASSDDDAGEDGVDDFLPINNGIRSGIILLAENQGPTSAGGESGIGADSDDVDDANGDLTVDFGFVAPDPNQVGVGNAVFIDADGSGGFDIGEGVDGIPVQLFAAAADPDTDTPVSSTVTSNGGLYQLTTTVAGNYKVHIPADAFQPGQPLANKYSMPGAGPDFGYDDDWDENGVDSVNPELTGITSITFTLSPDTEPTDFFGEFGQEFAQDNADDDNYDLTIDFGFTAQGAIGNLVFEDLNGNGRADPGEGIEGVTVQLFDSFSNPFFDLPLVEVTTDSDGAYLFSQVQPGSYFIHLPPVQFTGAGPLHDFTSLPGVQAGDDDLGDSGIDTLNPHIDGISTNPFQLSLGNEPSGSAEAGFQGDSDDARDSDIDLTQDFGLVRPGSIGDHVFHDVNANGLWEPNGTDGQASTADDEAGLLNVLVELWSPGIDGVIGGGDDSLVIGSRYTDSAGAYTFTGVPAGAYYVKIPADNFAPTGALLNLTASSPSAGGDDGIDNDDNGQQPMGPGADVYGPLVLLGSGENDPSIDFGFLESLSALTFAGWQVRHPDGSRNGALQDYESDGVDNLTEFALGLNSESGLMATTPWRIEVDPDTEQVDFVLVRPTGLIGVRFDLQGLVDLTQSPAGWQAIPSLPPAVITPLSDGLEEARYADLGGLGFFSGGTGAVRLRISLDQDLNGTPEETTTSPASGWYLLALGTGIETLSNPYVSWSRFSGEVEQVSGNLLDLGPALGPGEDLSTALDADHVHFIEVTAGTHAGHRWEVDEASSSATQLAIDLSSGLNTQTGLPSDLAGDRIVLRRHDRLRLMLPPTEMVATTNPTTADRALVYDSEGRFLSYWLFAHPSAPYWVDLRDGSLSDAGGLVVPPGGGIMVQSRTQPVNRILHGEIRAQPMRVPLEVGAQLIGNPWPVTTDAAQRGMTEANGFGSGVQPTEADQILRWTGDVNPQAQGYDSYFLLGVNALRYWIQSGDAELNNQNGNPLFEVGRATFIRSRLGHGDWLLPAPWTP